MSKKIIKKIFFQLTPVLVIVFFIAAYLLSLEPAFCKEKKSITGNLKICFMVDTSESMNKEQRFLRVKSALNAFIDSLIEGDYFILVTFDERAYLKYSGVVGDPRVREAIKRVFDSNYPESEPVTGKASNIRAGIEKCFEEIEKTPPYRSAALVVFTDGQHNPVPPPVEWANLCSNIKKWENQPGYLRSLFVVDMGLPGYSKKLAEDLSVEAENYFQYGSRTNFEEVLEKIRSKIPYSFDARVLPGRLNLGEFYKPSEAVSNKLIIINNPDFIEKGGYLIPGITYYRDGEEIENPEFSLNIPRRIDEEFTSIDLKILSDAKSLKPGKYKAEISLEPGGDLNANVKMVNERSSVIDSAVVSFKVKPGIEKYMPLIWAGVIFIVLIIIGLIYAAHYVKLLPAVEGQLVYHSAENCDVSPQSKELFQREKIFIYTKGKNIVTVGSRGDVRLTGIPFLEPEHFQVEAETRTRYKVKPIDGSIELLDSRENPRGGKTLKHNYIIRILNSDDPGQWVAFRFENRYIS